MQGFPALRNAIIRNDFLKDTEMLGPHPRPVALEALGQGLRGVNSLSDGQ